MTDNLNVVIADDDNFFAKTSPNYSKLKKALKFLPLWKMVPKLSGLAPAYTLTS
ncbi:hypothetical protein RQN30_00100 [Arcanobacterium hippocoleae]